MLPLRSGEVLDLQKGLTGISHLASSLLGEGAGGGVEGFGGEEGKL